MGTGGGIRMVDGDVGVKDGVTFCRAGLMCCGPGAEGASYKGQCDGEALVLGMPFTASRKR